MIEIRIARQSDAPAIKALMDLAISELQKGFLTPQQVESSRAGMGLDLQLIEDGTYFCVEEDSELVGCGGQVAR